MGFAAPANDELADTITIGEYLLRDKDSSYLLQMESNAMQGFGILRGDMIVFERTGSYKTGDIVVVLGDDGYTLQKLGASGKPLQIIGVVTGTFRKYK